MTPEQKAMKAAYDTLEALKGGDSSHDVWFAIGKATMTLKLVLPRELREDKGEK